MDIKNLMTIDRHVFYIERGFFYPTELSQSFYTSYWLIFEDFHFWQFFPSHSPRGIYCAKYYGQGGGNGAGEKNEK